MNYLALSEILVRTPELDTIQDISVVDQCLVIIRSVSGTTIHER